MFAHTYQLAFHRSGLAHSVGTRASRKRRACVDKNGIGGWGPVPDFCRFVKKTIRPKIRYWTLGLRILQLPAYPARPAQPPRQLCSPASSDPWPAPVLSRTTPACLPVPARQPALGFLSMKWGCLSYGVGEFPANSFLETVPYGWEYQTRSMCENFVHRAGRTRS